jgi:fructoselysine-6-P-deglycase FrlB-like protein
MGSRSAPTNPASSHLWEDTLRIPETLDRVLRRADGVDAVVERLRSPAVQRIVTSGNGAAWYAGLAIWLAALERPSKAAELLCIPSGLLARERFHWRPGDVLLAISSSGENRDLVEAVVVADPPPFVTVTADSRSTLGRRAVACASATLPQSGAFTHSTAYVANVSLGLAILSRLTEDAGLGEAVDGLPHSVASAIVAATAWDVDAEVGDRRPRMVLASGDGPAWAAALEAALLVREVARLPADGAELREGATSSMFGLGPDDLALILAVGSPGDAAHDLESEAATALADRGTPVVRLPGGELGDRRVAALLAFPASIRVALHLGAIAGVDPDTPETTSTYYRMARAVAAK